MTNCGAARPITGEVGLLFAEESEFFNVVQQKSSDYYAASVRGAYQGFFDNNIQPDFVLPQDIGNYKLIYVPYPVMLRSQTVAALQRYVRGGGALVCEGLPAYFGDHGHVGETQPNYGLDALFGCRQTAVEFDPDLSEDLQFELHGHQLFGRYFRQEYETAGGTAVGHFAGGAVAAVENRAGAGKTLIDRHFSGRGLLPPQGRASQGPVRAVSGVGGHHAAGEGQQSGGPGASASRRKDHSVGDQRDIPEPDGHHHRGRCLCRRQRSVGRQDGHRGGTQPYPSRYRPRMPSF